MCLLFKACPNGLKNFYLRPQGSIISILKCEKEKQNNYPDALFKSKHSRVPLFLVISSFIHRYVLHSDTVDCTINLNAVAEKKTSPLKWFLPQAS